MKHNLEHFAFPYTKKELESIIEDYKDILATTEWVKDEKEFINEIIDIANRQLDAGFFS